MAERRSERGERFESLPISYSSPLSCPRRRTPCIRCSRARPLERLKREYKCPSTLQVICERCIDVLQDHSFITYPTEFVKTRSQFGGQVSTILHWVIVGGRMSVASVRITDCAMVQSGRENGRSRSYGRRCRRRASLACTLDVLL